MIKINRDNFPPSDPYRNGQNRGVQKWRVAERKLFLDYRNNPDDFLNGSYTFAKHPSYELWRDELIRCQGNKCCYCEKVIDNGQIEHYRPKGGWQQQIGSNFNRPGYFWLAYRWSNLLLSCSECNNSSQKGNLFPISGIRAVTCRCNLALENQDLINPYDENPSSFISFHNSDPISLHPRGKSTIDTLKLNKRFDIVSARRDKFDLYSQTSDIANLPNPFGPFTQDKIDEAKTRLIAMKKSKSPFSGMIRENIKRGLL